MITRTAARQPIAPWQKRLAEAVSSVDELLGILGLEASAVDASLEAHRDFPLRVPRAFVARMSPGDPRDPLLLQVLPRGAELAAPPGYSLDPLDECSSRTERSPISPSPGLLHKYRGRVLVIATGACAVHCRYCFRRHFPYGEHQPWDESWRRALRYVAAEPSIEEVILSGGDPLSLADEKLAGLSSELTGIPHLARLRVHTRLPIVLPERVDDALLAWLSGTRLKPVMVVHANHGREIDGEVARALGRLRRAGVVLLNQAVLLAGVNDDVETLAELGAVLFDCGVLPYYLNLLDPVVGAAQFEVEEPRARRLVAELAARTSGYLVPRLVREVPGAPSKTTVDCGPAPDGRR